MAFSYYQTSVLISESANSIQVSATNSYSSTAVGGIVSGTTSASSYTTSCPTNYSSSSTGYESQRNGYASSLTNQSGAYNYFTSISGKSITYSSSSSSFYSFFDGTYSYGQTSSGSTFTKATNSFVSTSDFPYLVAIHTTNSSSYNHYSQTNNGTLNTSGASSGSLSGTSSGIYGTSREQIYSTFSFSDTYEYFPELSITKTSSFAFSTQTETATYLELTKEYTSYGTSTGTFTSTRVQDFLFYVAPVNMSHSYGIQYFRPIQPNTDSRYGQPNMRVFLSTGSSYLISNYNSLLNETISASFSFQNFAQPVGSSVNTSVETTISLSVNGVSEISQTTSLTSYLNVTFNYNSSTFGFLYPSDQYSYSYNSYSVTSTSIGYTNYATWDTIGSPNSAYSNSFTDIVSTTTTISDISCNIISYIIYTKSYTINTTSTFLSVSNIFLNQNSTLTEYAYSRFISNCLTTAVRSPVQISSFSSQKTLIGNFVKNITDETAYWYLNINTFAGIYNFSCKAIRGDGSPTFFKFEDCNVRVPFDPISTTITDFMINQSVSSDSLGTSISQTLSYGTTSSTRTFAVSYENSTGTLATTYDTIVDFDSYALLESSEQYFSMYPVVSIFAPDILNTYGQMGQANYFANGAYFKENSSSVSFITTTYSKPVSAEGMIASSPYADNLFSLFTIYTKAQSGDPAVLLDLPIQAFYSYGEE